MRILHVCTDFWPSTGGIEEFVLELARESRHAGIEPRVLCLNRAHRPERILPPRDAVDGLPIRRVPFVNLKYYKPAILPIAELADCDLVHVHGIGALLDYCVLAKPLHRRPIVLSTHGGIFHTTTLAVAKKIYFGVVQRVILRGVDRIAACSRSDYDLFARIAGRVELVENAVDMKRFMLAVAVPKDERRMLYVGRLARSKQIDLLLRVFAELARRRHDLSLHIAGPDWDGIRPELQLLASDLGVGERVQFLGNLADEQLGWELGQAQYFVLASRYEAFGLSVIEAMAAGCVPIVNDVASLRQIVRDSRDGAVVRFDQSADAAGAIERLMAMDTRALSASARARAQDYSWVVRMPVWQELYRQVAAREVAMKGATP